MDDPEITLATKRWLLQTMLEIRYFEEAAGQLYKKGKVKGGIHAYIGQEAIAAGVSAHLHKDDRISSTHRGHGHAIAKGADLKKLMAELMGKETGYCKGRGGSMHVTAADVGSLGAFPIVAAGVPIAAGAALSMQLRGSDQVAVAYFGDGALGQGTVYEIINMASIWKLPLVFVCENNCFAVSTRTENTVALKDILAFAASFGILGRRVQGQDVLKVYSMAQEMIHYARTGNGPALLMADTYRFEGHYFGEPEVYRSKDEVQKARTELDPIALFSRHLIENGSMEEREIQELHTAARDKISEALEYAEQSPDPAPEEYARYVYA